MNKLLFTASVSLLSIHVQAVNLDQVYQDALMNDPKFSAEAATAEAKRETVHQGKAKLLPDLTLEVGYGQSHSETDLSKGGVNRNDTSDVDADQTQWAIKAVQPLIDLTAWYQYRSTQAESREGNYLLEKSRQDLILRTAEAYLSILRAYDNLQAVKARVEAVKRQLEQTKQRFDVGLIAVTEVHETQAAYDSAQVDLISANSTLDIAFESLAQLTGKRYDSIHLMSDTLPMKGVSEYPKTKWEENALEANLELKIAAERLLAAQANHQAAKAGHYPKLSLSADYGQVESDYSKAQNGYKRNEKEGYSWSLSLSLPLYAGGSTSSRSDQAYYQSQAAEMNMESAQRTVLVSVRSLYRTIESDIQRVKARQQSILSSRSALEATQAGYEAGTRNVVEVLEAQQSLYQAEGNYANARYDYVLNVLKFKQAVGMLNATDIDTLNAWLDASKTLSSR